MRKIEGKRFVHLDLFSGIGGFSYAVDQVWKNAEHIFCDIEPFCQAVIRKHWPDSRIYADIRELIAHAKDKRQLQEGQQEDEDAETRRESGCGLGDKGGNVTDSNGSKQRIDLRAVSKAEGDIWGSEEGDISSRCGEILEIDLLTGGFPCQPFSHAGKRRGTDDNRYLWPEMLECVRLFRPRWVLAENVRGILSIEGGLVFEQVCLDLEGEGYEVWSFIIPAAGVNAPHRRDRIWIVAKSISDAANRTKEKRKLSQEISEQEKNGSLFSSSRQSSGADNGNGRKRLEKNTIMERNGTTEYVGNSEGAGQQGIDNGQGKAQHGRAGSGFDRKEWQKDWVEVATRLCGVDDGLPAGVDGLELSKSRHRIERLKALGNAIVPQVAIEIMKAIKEVDEKFI